MRMEDLKAQVSALERSARADDLEQVWMRHGKMTALPCSNGQVAAQLRKRVAELQEEEAQGILSPVKALNSSNRS